MLGLVGLFRRKKQPLPTLADRTIEFTADDLRGMIFSDVGNKSPDQNPSHIEAIKSVIRKAGNKPAEGWAGIAHLIPDPKKRRIKVVIDKQVVDQLSPESYARVVDRVTSPVAVKCELMIYGKGERERCHVMLDPYR
jgi:hypothetical protein